MQVDRIYLPVNMALALFHKHLKKHRNIFERGIEKIVVFCCIVLLIGIAYWPLLFLCGRTAPVIPLWNCLLIPVRPYSTYSLIQPPGRVDDPELLLQDGILEQEFRVVELFRVAEAVNRLNIVEQGSIGSQ